MIDRLDREFKSALPPKPFRPQPIRVQKMRECVSQGSENYAVYGRFCAGFSDACITEPSTRSGGRRRRSAKARNRGQEGAWFRRCELWGFEAWACLCSRGWNGERLAIWRVDRWREPCGAGVGMRFGTAVAMTRVWRSMIERAPSALSNGERQEWMMLCCSI